MKYSLVALSLFLAMPLLAAPIANVSKVDGRKSTVTAHWLIKEPATTRENAKSERGSKELPLSTSDDCAARYKIQKLLFKVDVGALTAGLSVVMVKQFAGRGAPPDVIIIMRNGKRSSLDLDSVIDVGAWPRRGYRIEGDFNADTFTRPDSWLGVEMRCY